jgi:hypothetical protein
MVIMPQLNNKQMISEAHKTTIVKGMTDIFPGSSPRVNSKAGGGAYGITTVVPSVDPEKFKQLGALIEETKTDVSLKRSGTGISVLIN